MGFAPTWLRQVSPLASQNHFNHCNQSIFIVAQVATDTARTTKKSYWGKSREGKTKQVKFKVLF